MCKNQSCKLIEHFKYITRKNTSNVELMDGNLVSWLSKTCCKGNYCMVGKVLLPLSTSLHNLLLFKISARYILNECINEVYLWPNV